MHPNIRRNEESSFLLYRRAIKEAIEACSSEEGEFSRERAKQVYGDVIEPKLAELEQKVKKAKRTLVTKPIIGTAAVGLALTFGYFTGLLPNETMEMAKALGGAKVIHDIAKQTFSAVDTKKEIMTDNMYFLWKVRRKAR